MRRSWWTWSSDARRLRAPYGAPARRDGTLSGMNIPFLDNWRKRHGGDRGAVAARPSAATAEGVAELLSECELLRVRAGQGGLELDDSPASLGQLDQLPPRWREDPEELPWLGNDAGLYLGTVIVRTVPGAAWQVWPERTSRGAARLGPGDPCGAGGPRVGGQWRARAVPGLRRGGRGLRGSMQPCSRSGRCFAVNTAYALFLRVECEVPCRDG